MTDPKARSESTSAPREAEYSAAVQMAIYESQLFWAIMGVFLLAETILAGFLLAAGPEDSPFALRVLGAILGLAITWLWIAALLRSSAYHKLRIYQAREIERRLGYKLFIEAEPFAAGRCVIIDEVRHQQPRMARWPTIKHAGVALALLFAFLFLVVLGMQLGS